MKVTVVITSNGDGGEPEVVLYADRQVAMNTEIPIILNALCAGNFYNEEKLDSVRALIEQSLNHSTIYRHRPSGYSIKIEEHEI